MFTVLKHNVCQKLDAGPVLFNHGMFTKEHYNVDIIWYGLLKSEMFCEVSHVVLYIFLEEKTYSKSL